MKYQNKLQSAIDKAKAELEAAQKSLIIYNYLLTLDGEFNEWDAFRLSTNEQDRLNRVLTVREADSLELLIFKHQNVKLK